jgi:1,4-dihydroxy-2-naphthoate octaprenyltransferase
VISHLDEEGYPFSFTANVTIDIAGQRVRIDSPLGLVSESTGEVSLLKSHITPIPNAGYTDRRYVLLQGKIKQDGQDTIMVPEKSFSWDEKVVPFPEYCEKNLPQAKRYMEQIEPQNGKAFRPFLPPFAKILRITRLPFLVASTLPVAVGAVVAARAGFFSLPLFILTLLGIALAHVGLNTANDYFDSYLGTDWKNTKPTPFSGGSRSLQYNLISTFGLGGLATGSFVGAAAIGIYLSLLRGPLPILGFMLAGFFLAIFYTAPPFKLVYRGLGELSVVLGFGPVIVGGTYFIQTQHFAIAPFLISIPVGIFVCCILYLNEIPDIGFDQASGKRTLVTRMSKKTVMRGYLVLVAIAMTVVVVSAVLRFTPVLSLISLLVIFPAYSVYKTASQAYGDQYAMIPVMAKNVKLLVYFGGLMLASYITTILFGLP